MKIKKGLKISVAVLLALMLVGATFVISTSLYVSSVGEKRILTPNEAAELFDIDCILVLGCLVKKDGTPSDRLADRINRGVELYKLGVAPKILMSGDHGREDYNEVGAMKDAAINAGVPSSDIFMDHAGFSTYESVYRAKEIFGADKILIVTQKYHLKRALYIARELGVEAYGVSADYHEYRDALKHECREFLARTKDFVYAAFKPEPTFLGEAIPVSGDGDITNN